MAAIALSVLLLLLVSPSARADSWQRPVDGALLREFTLGPDFYAAGQHRGVDLDAAPGSPVRSACAGRASFAGRVPRGGRTVSVRCGRLVATYQQLGEIAVRRGQSIVPGMRVGVVGHSSDPRAPRPHVHLGARVAATGRYVDPLTLLRGTPPLVPPLPPATLTLPRTAPPGRAAPRAVPLGTAPAPARAPVSRPASPWAGRLSPTPAPLLSARPDGEKRLPWSVWVGLACAGLGLPIGGFVRLRRRRSATAQVAQTA
ncbi:MAG: M23 family metallopeptidase [Solirubrobacteraceae bacterium]